MVNGKQNITAKAKGATYAVGSFFVEKRVMGWQIGGLALKGCIAYSELTN
nr:hypothetical protein [Paenibacillus sp. PL91]